MVGDKLDVLGTRVDLIDNNAVLQFISSTISTPQFKTRFIIYTGFHGLHVAYKDQSFRKICNSSDLLCPDGIAPVLIARALGKKAERAPGPDLLRAFLVSGHHAGYSSYFLGDTEKTLNELRRRIEVRYPGHRIAGMYSPPFRSHSQAEVDCMISAINAAKPDVLWVGLGLPKQERWIFSNLEKLRVPVAIGIGAAFAMEAGIVSRAPKWVGRSGLEWLWRLGMEPRKLWRRALIEGPSFIFTILRHWQTIRASNVHKKLHS